MGAIDTSKLTILAPIVILVAVGASLVIRGVRGSGRRRTASSWPVTSGTILMSTIQVQRTGSSRREIPVVVYSYQVGRDVYQGSRIRVGDELGSVSVSGHARSVLSRYPVGSTVHVFYDPTDPRASALER